MKKHCKLKPDIVPHLSHASRVSFLILLSFSLQGHWSVHPNSMTNDKEQICRACICAQCIPKFLNPPNTTKESQLPLSDLIHNL